MRILITGASGSGQSTLAAFVAQINGYHTLDGDDFFWIPSDPPYVNKRELHDRHDLIVKEVEAFENVILSGSIVGWGEKLEGLFELIVFLYVPTKIRMQRLVARETARFGKIDAEFEDWSSKYDLPETEGRSLEKHRTWLSSRKCPVLFVEGTDSPSQNAELVLNFIERSATSS